jgi:hypothetical protein
MGAERESVGLLEEDIAMGAIGRCLKSVPLWVWIFVAASQVLSLCARLTELPDLNQAIQRLADESAESANSPAIVEIKCAFERIRRQKRIDLVAAAFLAPLSTALAYWKWSSRRGSKANTDVRML